MTSKDSDQNNKWFMEDHIPNYLKDDYPFIPAGKVITGSDVLTNGIIYEIKCLKCEMSIRSQGRNIRAILEHVRENGCIGCGNKDIVLNMIDMKNFEKE